MNRAEKKMLEFRKYFEDAGLSFCLNGGSLLKIIRDGRVDRLGVDDCITVTCLLKDITEEVVLKMRSLGKCETEGWHTRLGYNPSTMEKIAPFFKHGQWVFFDDNDPLKNRYEMYAIEEHGDKVFTRFERVESAWWWKREDYFPWKKHRYIGKWWNIPNNPEGIFESRYGKDWKTPDQDWHGPVNNSMPIRKLLNI